jgi:hypothetical protein
MTTQMHRLYVLYSEIKMCVCIIYVYIMCVALHVFWPGPEAQTEKSFVVLISSKNCLKSTMGQQILSYVGLTTEPKLPKALEF